MTTFSQLLAEHCPDGVSRIKIGDFAQCYAGATPDSRNPSFWMGGSIPWMSSGEVNKGTVYNTEKHITQLGFDSCSTKLVPSGAVVIALAGQGKTRGTVARTRIELCTNQSLCSIIPSDLVDSDFLYFFLTSQYKELRNMSSGDGGRGGLNLQIIKDVLVPVPPKPVQVEIVRILNSYQSLETELTSVLTAEIEARKKQLTAIKEKHLFDSLAEMPKTALGEVAILWLERTSEQLNQTNYVGVENLVSNFGGRQDSKSLPSTSAISYQPHDILIGNIRPYLRKVWYSDRHGGSSADVLTVRIKDESKHLILTKYLFHILASDRFIAYSMAHAKGAKMPRGSKKAVFTFTFPLPPLKYQQEAVQILDGLDINGTELIVRLQEELDAREIQFSFYRDQLFSFQEA